VRHSTALLGLLCCASLAWGQEVAVSAPEVRGVTVSCQTWGWEWGSDDMVEALQELRGLGANWVVIHPYARIQHDGTVRAFRLEGGQAPAWLTRPITEAHRLGLKIAIKPHLAYWGTKWSWRGEIAFDQPAHWARFFRDYQAWIEQVVAACAGADAFIVGTELDKTLDHEAAWRRVIAAVRARTQAPLTYAANWTDYRRVPFWDALDVVGVQGYFPLVRHQKQPCRDELDLAWAELLGQLKTYGAEVGKKVVFTELGYDSAPTAARQPWESGRGRGGPEGEATQRLCLEAALDALRGEQDAVVGAFLWKWFPGDSRGEDFLMSTPAMREVIGARWR
jgi:hypothetical protein